MTNDRFNALRWFVVLLFFLGLSAGVLACNGSGDDKADVANDTGLDTTPGLDADMEIKLQDPDCIGPWVPTRCCTAAGLPYSPDDCNEMNGCECLEGQECQAYYTLRLCADAN